MDTQGVRSREAYGVRGACSRCRTPQPPNSASKLGALQTLRVNGHPRRTKSRSVWSAWSLLPLSHASAAQQRQQAGRTPNASGEWTPQAYEVAKRMECVELAPAVARLSRPTAPASWAHSKRFG